MGGLVSSPNIIMANISKPLSILFLLFAIANGLRIRKRIKIPKHGTNSSNNANTFVSQRPRETRFLNPFSLFNIITFSNTECTTSSGTEGRYRILLEGPVKSDLLIWFLHQAPALPVMSAPHKAVWPMEVVPRGSGCVAASQRLVTPAQVRMGLTSSARPQGPCPPCAVSSSPLSMTTSARWSFNTFVLLTNKIHSPIRSGSTLKRYRYRIPMRTETATLNTSRLENMKIIPRQVVSPLMSSSWQKTFEILTLTWASPDLHLTFNWL